MSRRLREAVGETLVLAFVVLLAVAATALALVLFLGSPAK